MTEPTLGAVLDLSDTIVALATPPGRGALAIVRLSGPAAHDIARAALDRWPEQPRAARVSVVRDSLGEAVDEAVVLRYDAPASFTGEHAVELMTHGGAVVPTTVLAALIARGARLARPGEFTRRAVLNGKLDILQAEATGDLVSASSHAAQRAALRQLDGGLSRRVLALRDDLIALEALIAYDIDFPEEDDGPIAPARISAAADAVVGALDRLLATARAGELVREGALVVLAGAPNVGKSSLFNAILGQARAIVTDIPGTTRDAIEAIVDTPTIPLRLVDTAGLRQAVDPVERIGVEVSESYLERASLVLLCADSAETLAAAATTIAERTRAPLVVARTKSDLAPVSDEALAADLRATGARAAVAISAESGAGLEALVQTVVKVIVESGGEIDLDAPVLTQERHRFAVATAFAEASAFRDVWTAGEVPAPVAAVHLRTAVQALEDLVGRVDVEEILDEVFRRFCVGK